MQKKNIIGEKFEKLTVISPAPNIPPKNGEGRSFTAWNCQCECGNIIVVRTATLVSKQQKSCGCHISTSGIAIKIGEKFNKLTTVSYEKGYWNCQCECGTKTFVLTHHLISKNTQSCGCLRSNEAKNNIKKAIKTRTIYDPKISSARKLWRQYKYNDKKCTLTFDEWFKLSQDNCYYCGIQPFNNYNYFLKRKNASQDAKDNGNFIYNGIDRVNSNLPHTLNNCVTCCYTCNKAKSDRNIDDFYKYIKNLSYNNNLPQINLLDLPTKYLLSSVKEVYRHYIRNYKTMEIDLQTFYTLSQLPCYYCNNEKSNLYNIYLNNKKSSKKSIENANYYYNGIDRIDNNLSHVINNIVPCCKYCNFSKSSLLIQEFYSWIKRIKNINVKN